MKRFLVVSLFIFVIFPTKELNSWGFHGYKLVNRYAVFTMSEELIGFLKNHIDYLTEHSVDADKRRYTVIEEAPRYYIDTYGPNPFLEEIIIEHKITKEDARGEGISTNENSSC
jgi:hypothetical protein|tara:strand:- start:217 stop:558 length:342 start_codon:yes stop_codon:yes gene_type:complete